MIHFIVLGAVLFGVSRYGEPRSQTARITISKDQVARIADQYRKQYGTSPPPPQLDALVDKFIVEEIAYREAIRLGLDTDDEIVRRRMVQKYEFLQQDLSMPAEPTDAQLLDFYLTRLDRYRSPARVTFTQVYFSPDRRGDAGAHEAASTVAAKLNAQHVTRGAERGDPYPGPDEFAALSPDELSRVFGSEGLSESVFHIDTQRWSTPLRSGFGWHTVYVSARQAEQQAAFTQVRDRVRRDFIEAERVRRNADAFAKLRGNFEVVRE